MNCVMGHIQIERSFFFYGFGDLPIRFYSQRFTQEGICTVIFLQVRNCSNLLSLDMPVSPFAIIAAGMSNAGTCDIYIKADIQRILSFASHTAEMCFSYMNGFISGLLQDSRHGRHIFSETFPVPLGRSERIPVVALSINPVSDSMPGRILSGHDGSSGRGTHALCVKSRETNTLFSQSLHIRSMIPVIQRMTHRLTTLICDKRNRRIHKSHVIYKEDNNIRAFLSHPANGRCQTTQYTKFLKSSFCSHYIVFMIYILVIVRVAIDLNLLK